MTALNDVFVSVATQFVGRLPEAAVQRVAALAAVRGLMPEADVSDRMALANYILTGLEMIPEPRDDPYPYPSGDGTVLGPKIFSSTAAPAENTVINWQGENFIPQRDVVVTDPGPLVPATEEIQEFDPESPAPMAGAHWRGRRGDRSG